jgi:hypothetical protein
VTRCSLISVSRRAHLGRRGAGDLVAATAVALTLSLLAADAATAHASDTQPVLRLQTSHGTFRVCCAPLTSTETRANRVTTSDGVMGPKTPPIGLRFGEAVRFSLPAALPGHAALLYNAARLSYRRVAVDLDVARPVWRPNTVGTYVVVLDLKATWKSATDSGTSESRWEFKVRVAR